MSFRSLFCLLFFSKYSFKNTFRVSTSLDTILLGLMWVQTVYKGCPQTGLVGKEIKEDFVHVNQNLMCRPNAFKCKHRQFHYLYIFIGKSFCLFALMLYIPVNSNGYVVTISSLNSTLSWASLSKRLISTACTYFRL